MPRIPKVVLPSLGIALIVLLAWPQLAAAQRLKPIPHPIGVMQQSNAHAQAAAQASPEAHAQVRAAISTTSASPWTPLTNQPNFLVDGASVPILLTDGSVLVQDAGFPDWWKLTPDKFGSYVNGTWTQVASLPATYSPLYHSSAGLPDGRLIIEGGEYLLSLDQTQLVPTWTPQGSIYDPIANTWTPVAPPAFFGGFWTLPTNDWRCPERRVSRRDVYAGRLLHHRRGSAQCENPHLDANRNR